MTCPINIFFEEKKGLNKIVSEDVYESWISAIAQEQGMKRLNDYKSLSVGIVDKETIQSLNKTYRGKDKPTNVLAFPATQKDLRGNKNISLGDLAICPEVLLIEAKEQSKEVEAHLAHLFIHGLLHLLGLDHETKREIKEMEELEIKILSKLGIDDPYQIDLI